MKSKFSEFYSFPYITKFIKKWFTKFTVTETTAQTFDFFFCAIWFFYFVTINNSFYAFSSYIFCNIFFEFYKYEFAIAAVFFI